MDESIGIEVEGWKGLGVVLVFSVFGTLLKTLNLIKEYQIM
jgi:hypothetical protein